MPMYMDIHEIRGATAEDIAKAHSADVETQRKYGVEYHKYWFNESCGKIFCLCSAPSPEAAASVHREAHGLLTEKIIEVAPEIAEGFLGEVKSIVRAPLSFPAARETSATRESGPFCSRIS